MIWKALLLWLKQVFSNSISPEENEKNKMNNEMKMSSREETE